MESPQRSSTSATFGFATVPRADGSRGMVLISLYDVSQIPAGATTEQMRDLLQRYAAQAIDAVARRRTEWSLKTTETTVGEVPAIRHEWSGVAELPNGGGSAPMRGVMLVGMEAGVAFTLHTQDFVEHPDALKAGEQSLRTFRVRKAAQ